MGSPYRKHASPRGSRRVLSFYHARLLLMSVVSVGVLCLGAALITTPREVTLECRPEAPVTLSCRSVARSIWGESPRKTARAEGTTRPRDAFDDLLDREPQAPPLTLDIDYQRKRGDSWSSITARYGYGRRVELTERFPTRFGTSLIRDLSNFSRALNDGKVATLEYRSGWGGEMYAVLTPLVVLGFLFPSSGRTRVTVAPDDGEVTVESRSFWLARTQRRTLPLDGIAKVVVVSGPATRGRRVFLPALRLDDGELVQLGKTGLSVPTRAEHWADRVSELLGVPREKRVQYTSGDS